MYAVPAGFVAAPHAADLIRDGAALAVCETMAATAVELAAISSGGVQLHAGSSRDFSSWLKNDGAGRALVSVLSKLSAPRPSFAGLSLDSPRVMGIVNVTPDSFSDGGDFHAAQDAIEHGLALLERGADILDVGGESTRPGAPPVSPEEEQERVLPVIRELAGRGALVSVDTRHAATMEAAVGAGARIVNDVTALTGDRESLNIVAKLGVPVILMHMQGEPRTMQKEPSYIWAPGDVFDYLSDRIEVCVAAGVEPGNICVDPGIGFGKTDRHNAEILSRLSLFHGTGCPIVLGASRKSFIGRMSRGEPVSERLAGSLAAVMVGLRQGVQIFRVHDVAETVQALAVYRRVCAGS